MTGIGKLAVALAFSAGAAVAGGISSPALADGQPVIDFVDNVVPNPKVLSDLLPNVSVAPSVLCIPTAQNTNSTDGDRNRVGNNQTINCTQSAQQTTSPANALRDYEKVTGQPQTLPVGLSNEIVVMCPAGKVALGGGYLITGNFPPNTNIDEIIDAPTAANDGWRLQFLTAGSTQFQVVPFVTCARPS
ncbi:hypothetical protein ACIBQ1_12635 [Nonomuraea sp. NPDC050153]|uniref:hypothetical protein n=1 Tax=Nonomuraea sp. NPDC050153 TaxID=3364359 RepID=UPI0037A59B4C